MAGRRIPVIVSSPLSSGPGGKAAGLGKRQPCATGSHRVHCRNNQTPDFANNLLARKSPHGRMICQQVVVLYLIAKNVNNLL
jgi:hypothetical protein